uniref:Uncharacterized protein n=1 Tax=Romanomermis culicivorax TaxID=13658 RepID=A0A915J2M3_ROMCU
MPHDLADLTEVYQTWLEISEKRGCYNIGMPVKKQRTGAGSKSLHVPQQERGTLTQKKGKGGGKYSKGETWKKTSKNEITNEILKSYDKA